MTENNEFDPIGGDGVPASPDAVPQETSPRIIITAQPIQWEAHRSGQQWTEGRYGYCITLESEDLPETPYVATLGEGDPETFATLAEAQAWCQRDIDATVARWAVVAVQPPQAAQPVAWATLCDDTVHSSSLTELAANIRAEMLREENRGRDFYIEVRPLVFGDVAAPPAAPQPTAQEPFAFMFYERPGRRREHLKLAQVEPPPEGAFPVYTAPQPQAAQPVAPLTEEEIAAIPCADGDGSDWDALVRFARAIERAHGIKDPAAKGGE